MSNNNYLVAIDFPVRFSETGNIELSVDDKAINDTMKTTMFVRKNGIPLFPLGIGVQDMPFDPADEATKAWLTTRTRDGLLAGVETIMPTDVGAEELVGKQNTLSLTVFYINRVTSERRSVIIPTDKVRTDS
jgi:hypothetical protein